MIPSAQPHDDERGYTSPPTYVTRRGQPDVPASRTATAGGSDATTRLVKALSGRRGRTTALAAGTVTALAGAGLAIISMPAANAAISPTSWYTVTNVGSGKCVDSRSAATANGTAVQQYTCNGTTAQDWRFQPTDGDYLQIGNRNST